MFNLGQHIAVWRVNGILRKIAKKRIAYAARCRAWQIAMEQHRRMPSSDTRDQLSIQGNLIEGLGRELIRLQHRLAHFETPRESTAEGLRRA